MTDSGLIRGNLQWISAISVFQHTFNFFFSENNKLNPIWVLVIPLTQPHVHTPTEQSSGGTQDLGPTTHIHFFSHTNLSRLNHVTQSELT